MNLKSIFVITYFLVTVYIQNVDASCVRRTRNIQYFLSLFQKIPHSKVSKGSVKATLVHANVIKEIRKHHFSRLTLPNIRFRLVSWLNVFFHTAKEKRGWYAKFASNGSTVCFSCTIFMLFLYQQIQHILI